MVDVDVAEHEGELWEGSRSSSSVSSVEVWSKGALGGRYQRPVSTGPELEWSVCQVRTAVGEVKVWVIGAAGVVVEVGK